ncbi:MAG: hypothetical protein M1347_08120 [Chloroflexi bacterium]|nr:hypothetical protein [Chloroflexota bacterium]
MNDQFLYDIRPEMRKAFADELYTRLSQSAKSTPRLKFAYVLLGTLAILLVAAAAWQFMTTNAHFETEINGITINEMDYKIIDSHYYEPIKENPDALSRPGPTQEPRNVFDIMAELPYRISLPSWIPEGMELYELNQDDPGLWSAFFHLEWFSSEDGPSMSLMVHQIGAPMEEKVDAAPHTWKKVNLGEVEAVLVRGNFRFPFNSLEDYLQYFNNGGTWRPAFWDENYGLRLFWTYQDVYYELVTPSSGCAFAFVQCERLPKLSEGDLIKVAESMIK